jgi:hypothetical protein
VLHDTEGKKIAGFSLDLTSGDTRLGTGVQHEYKQLIFSHLCNTAATYLLFVYKSFAYIFFCLSISCQIPENLQHVSHKNGFRKTKCQAQEKIFFRAN